MVLVLLAGLPALADSGIQPVGRIQWTEASPGVRISRSSWRRPDGSEAELIAVKADGRRYTIRTLLASSYHLPHTTANDMRRRSGALVVVNGPFFDTDGKAMGLIVADGRKVQGWPPPSGANGCVFGIRDGRPFVEPRQTTRLAGVTQAVQAAPRLISRGRPTDGIFEPDRISRRTGVAVTGRGEILLYCTDGWTGLSFHEVQAILLRAEFAVQDCMALDGGASTQMDLRVGSQDLSVAAPDEVPVLLGLFRK